jgi:hypothetical protein
MQTKIVTKAKMHSGKCRQRDSKKFFERNLPIVSPQKKKKQICKHNIQRGKKIVGLYAQ